MFTNKLVKTVQFITFLLFGHLFSSAAASNTLSCNHLNEQDLQAGLKHCTEETKQHSTASVILAQMYEIGMGVEKNTKKAESYYLTAVLGNNVDAQIALGKLQAKENNALQSYIFFSLAVSNGSLDAIHLKNAAKKGLSAEELSLSRDFIHLVKEAIADKNMTQ